DQDELGQHRADQQQQDPGEVIGDDRQIEVHADADEEQAEQDVAKRLDVLFDLIAVLGFRDQHAGQKRAQRERQAGELGQRRQPERDQQHIEHEQLRRTQPRDDVEPPVHHFLAEEQDRGEREGGFAGGDRQRFPQVGASLGQRRDRYQERDHRQ